MLPSIIDELQASAWVDPTPSLPSLNRASARIRRAAKQRITADESIAMCKGAGPWRLPERPVREVVSVTTLDGTPITYRLVGNVIYPDSGCLSGVTVIYAHGWAEDEIPDQIAELVATVAARLEGLKSTPALAGGVASEGAGSENVSYGANAYAGVAGLTAAEKSAVRMMFPTLPFTTHTTCPRFGR